METASDSTHILLLVAAVYLFIKVWPRIKAFVGLWRYRFTPDRFILAETPGSHAEQVVLTAGAAEIEPLGFAYSFSFDLEQGEQKRRYDYHALPDVPGTSALVTTPHSPGARPYDLHLQTRFQSIEGEELLIETVGGAVDLYSPGVFPHEAFLGSIPTQELWREHQNRVQKFESAGNRRIMEDMGKACLEQWVRLSEERMQKHTDDGSYVRNRDGSYRHTASAALAALKNSAATPNSGKQIILDSAFPESQDAMRLEAARCSLTRTNQENAATPGYLILFVISLVASVIGLWLWGGWQTAVFLTIVIFIHEMGHFLGMKMCGYRDAKIFFVPMLGGVAVGKKSNPSPVQELIVLLLGPVPGLFLGLATILAYAIIEGAPEWLYNFGVYAFVINYLNLLPAMPLDGGRVLNALFMRRYPRLQFVFSIVSIILLAVGAVLLSSVLLGMIALFGLLRLRTEWFTGTIEKEVLPQLSSELPDQDETTLLVVQTMRNHPIPEPLRPLPTRISLVNQIVEALSRMKASITVMIIGSMVYFLSLVVPVCIGVVVLVLFSGELGFDDFDAGEDAVIDESVIKIPEVEIRDQ